MNIPEEQSAEPENYVVDLDDIGVLNFARQNAVCDDDGVEDDELWESEDEEE